MFVPRFAILASSNWAAAAVASSLLAGHANAADSVATPRPVPLTRPEMKELIEDVKVRTPRIPLPELSAEDREKLGDRADSYESVLRHLYTPWANSPQGPRTGTTGSRGGSREQDPAMTLDNAFKTQLFWIASRVNNCQYCMGHQESKLLSAGLSEDQIAALDGDWSGHTPAERAAFAFARKLSFAPHELADADLDGLREHYTDLQILEMTLSVSRNNVSNRWKEGIGVPQRADEGGYSRSSDDPKLPRGTYVTPTSAQYRNLISKVAPVAIDPQSNQPTSVAVFRRPSLESREQVDQMLAGCRSRQARLPLVDEVEARKIFGDKAPAGPLPNWALLLANFPRDGAQHLATIRTADEQGDLSPLLKAQMSWIIARQDRAWYALGQSLARLRQLGQSDSQIDQLDGDWQEFSAGDRALFVVAKKLAASPVVLTDREVTEAVNQAGPRAVVQTIHYTTSRAFFNRFTEAAGLPLEE